MPRYDLKCQRCKRETVIYIPESMKNEVKYSDFNCEYCGCDDLIINAYCESVEIQLIALQQQIDDLERKINSMCGIESANDCDTTLIN